MFIIHTQTRQNRDLNFFQSVVMVKGPSTPTTDPGMTSDDGELEITPTAVQLNMQVDPI